MTLIDVKSSKRILAVAGVFLLLAACASKPQITRLPAESGAADPPYKTVLVVSVFKSFDVRRYHEKETVKALEAAGTKAVAMTSLADSRVPLNRSTVIPMVAKVGADAVLVTQLKSLQSDAEFKDRSPEATYNIESTYYYNVFSVELTEYVEPPGIQYQNHLVLRADLYSAANKKSVWAVESKSDGKPQIDTMVDYSRTGEQATAIARALIKDGMIGD